MTLDNDKSIQPALRLPGHLFLYSVVIAEIVPFLARFPSVPMRGWEWFTDYLLGIDGHLFFLGFNLIPGVALYGLGKMRKRAPLAFWFAAAAGVGFLLWAHGTLNLRSSSTAVIALVFIPIYGVGAAVIGWAIGLLAHTVVRIERGRVWLAGIVCTAAVLLGAGSAVYESITVGKREARFPAIIVSDLPLSKREVFPCSLLGSVEVLALGNFDSDLENEIAVLGTSRVALIRPGDYVVKTKTDFAQDNCEECVHMYPYLVPDGKGSLVVASSDGVADSRGHLRWALKASGFTRLVPIQVDGQEPTFFAYHSSDRIERYDIDGKVLWSVKLCVSDVGTYVTPEGERLPFALTGYGKSRNLKLYDLGGRLVRTIQLPEWASNVEEIAWPARGHLLVGAGSWVGVLDQDGKEVFRHIIENTSFNPYHGPDGTAVQFNSSQEPYLAIMSHGSSGYARSVLLIFDPKGRLVWQEEVNKLSAMLAMPRAEGTGEVLLVGGMDGVTEYSLAKTSEPNQTLKREAVKNRRTPSLYR